MNLISRNVSGFQSPRSLYCFDGAKVEVIQHLHEFVGRVAKNLQAQARII
jgi:hypothetical protein